jgi:hypothetical protein
MRLVAVAVRPDELACVCTRRSKRVTTVYVSFQVFAAM